MFELVILLISSVVFTVLLSATLVFLEMIADPSDRKYLAKQVRKLWAYLHSLCNKRTRD
jgi:hypothetical protein